MAKECACAIAPCVACIDPVDKGSLQILELSQKQKLSQKGIISDHFSARAGEAGPSGMRLTSSQASPTSVHR